VDETVVITIEMNETRVLPTDIPYGPVRDIGMNSTSLTGAIPSAKNKRVNKFESSLERDFIRITEFNSNVSEFIEQPVEIHYENDGKARRYVPDFLIYYNHTTVPGKWLKPLLVEVKYRDDLRENWQKYKPKFMAAMKFCEGRGWKFKILTEVEIRTEFLKNANFLQHYKHATVDTDDFAYLLRMIHELRVTTPAELLVCCSGNSMRRAALLYCLWYMVANTVIGVDLSRKITMDSSIWDNSHSPENTEP
jgi:hypothetical protein